MSLIVNEIHIQNGFKRSFQIAAADRRITWKGKYDSTRRKIFPIDYLKATISYFGLAAFPHNRRIKYMSEWLPEYIKKSHSLTSLGDFALDLRNTLNSVIDPSTLGSNISGFHLSGFNSNGQPEFWYFSNIDGMEGFRYGSPTSKYANPSSDFLERDALKPPFKWDQEWSIDNGTQIYRNGDIRTHALASEEVDKVMDQIFMFSDFNRPATLKEYAHYVKFKFEIISFIYKKFTKVPIIARPIDVFIIENGIVTEFKG